VTTIQPTSELDLFDDSVLLDPYPAFAGLREMAPAVWLPRYGMWATARYSVARRILGDWRTFTSEQGTALTDAMNEALAGTVLSTDPPLHDTLRAVLSSRLAPKALRSLGDYVQGHADAIVTELVDAKHFDAVGDLAERYTVAVVAGLIGVPEDVRGKLLGWGEATLNLVGVDNDRYQAAFPVAAEMFSWLGGVMTSDLVEGSMGRAIYDAADAGAIERHSAPSLLSAYTAAALDTTISLITAAIALFAEHTRSWQRLRQDQQLIPAALLECARYESPVQWASRVCVTDTDLDGVVVPEGQRITILLGAANRDSRQYPDAGRFDIDRNPIDHLAFGYGTHGCAGQGLARLEATSMFKALAARVERFELEGEPVRRLNNLTRGWGKLPVRVVPA
jgi:cytochrome P450